MVLGNRNLWLVAAVYFCLIYVEFGCLVWIPSFLTENYSMSVNRASTLSFLIFLPGVFASPLAGFVSDHWLGGRRKPLVFAGMAVLSGSVLILSFEVSLLFAMPILAIVGLMVLIPDVLLATYPSDILTRKLAATATGFIVTFTSLSGIISTTVSGKIIDSFNSYGALFFSFALMAATGTVLTLLIREREISERTEKAAA